MVIFLLLKTEREWKQKKERRGADSNAWSSLSFDPYLTKVVLYKILAYGLILFLVIMNVERYDQARKMIYVVIIFGLFQGVYGLIDFLTGHNYIFFYKKVFGERTVTGTFINRNHLAGYLEMVIPLSLAYCLERLEKRKVERRANWKEKFLSIENFNSQYAFLLFCVVIMAFALLFSMSRMGIICLFIALALMGLAFSLRRQSGFHRKIFVAAVVAMLVLGILAGVGEIIARFQGLSGDLQGEGARLDVWRDSFKMVGDYPWFGIGAGNYALLFQKYRSLVSDLFLFIRHHGKS